MTSAREDILANIRRSLGVSGSEAPRRANVATRLQNAPAGLIPARGQLDPAGRVAMFKEQAERAQASVTEVARPEDVPGEVARFLRDHNLPATIRIGTDAGLTAMPWDETALDVSTGRSNGGDPNAVSHAFGGVAESGTLAMLSGPDNPTTLNFLPDNHIVIVSAAEIAGDYETIWQRLRQQTGKGTMPRTVNLITGPSRSADIEQTLLLGAHGPRTLHIIIVGEPV
ncbi:MAG: L-lactate dehydrogenase complex protein LldG [Methylobacteriaceae bacterium]|jgi:L-lactate dehydrogenase complex protein LldG|nr:L-lactate dehydrogenase complex protein LldG [Methylobacteriaceae bacterium]